MHIIRKVNSLCSRIVSRFYSYWQLKTLAQYGKNIKIYGKVNIINPSRLIVGNDCTFNHNSYINAFNPVIIGNDVTISAYASIISAGIDVNSWMYGKGKCHIRNKGIYIGDHVWIGAHAQILGDVHIRGSYVVIAAGSVVTKDIDDSYCLVAGCPASVIKYYDKDI